MIPAAGGVNPTLARLVRHKRRHRKRERHGRTHIAEIKHGRMDRHRPPLQQWIKTSSIRNTDDSLSGHQHLEWADDEGNEADEECIGRHQNGNDDGDHLAKFAAIGANGDGRVGG
jgi:hypothetical protein